MGAPNVARVAAVNTLPAHCSLTCPGSPAAGGEGGRGPGNTHAWPGPPASRSKSGDVVGHRAKVCTVAREDRAG